MYLKNLEIWVTNREFFYVDTKVGPVRPIHFDIFRYHLPCVTHGKRLSHLYHVLHMVNV